MTRHDDSVRLVHMLEHAREAVELAKGLSREDLEKNRVMELALTRLVEIVGESAALDGNHRSSKSFGSRI